MAVTIRDVARKAGVAIGTVSRVINQHSDVDPALRSKVEQAFRDLNYRPNARARYFARNSSPIISFVLSNRGFLHPVHAGILQGVEEYCEDTGYFVLFTKYRYSPETRSSEMKLPSVLQSHGIADCLILAGTNYDNFIDVLEKDETNYVLLANNLVTKKPHTAEDQVRFNDFQGALDASNYLIQLGHRDVWYIGDTSLPWYHVRHEAYRQAMEQAGLQPRAQTFGFSEDRFTNGLLSAQSILEQSTPVSALFCGTDQVAYGAWEALRSRGLEVPRDISLIGFDDQREEFRVPSLTSVRVDTIEVGRQLAKMAIAKIRTKGKRHPEVIVPTTLVIRETCRPPLRHLASLIRPQTAHPRRHR